MLSVVSSTIFAFCLPVILPSLPLPLSHPLTLNLELMIKVLDARFGCSQHSLCPIQPVTVDGVLMRTCNGVEHNLVDVVQGILRSEVPLYKSTCILSISMS
jgi:hypothetical protein